MATKYQWKSPSLRLQAVLEWLWWGGLPGLLAAACYANSLQGQLVHDDIFAIKENLDLLPSTPLSQLFKNDFWGESMASPSSHKSYRPLTVLSFRFNYMLHGLSPWGYHVGNLCLHLLVTLVFGGVCWGVVFQGVKEGLGAGYCSWLAMLLFAAHPIHTEAVSGVVGRADVLASLLFLISLWCYLQSVQATSHRSMITRLLVGVVCAGTAMLCKEHGATVLGVCLAYDILVVNRPALLKVIGGRGSVRNCSALLIRAAILIISALVLLVLRVSLLHGHLPHFSEQDNPASFAESPLTRGLTYAYLVYFNLRLLLYPLTLCYDWQMGSIPLVESLTDLCTLLAAGTFLCLVLLFWAALQPDIKCHAPLWGLLLLVVPFLPASNLFIRVGFVVAERVLYLPSMGWCVLVVGGLRRLHQNYPRLGHTLLSLFLLLLLVFSTRTVTRNTVWRDRRTLFRSALATVPNNAKAHFNYANFLKDSGRGQEAIQFYRNAVRLSPSHAVSHNNLGTLLSGQEAEFHFRQALHHNPQHYKAAYNLARNLEAQGKLMKAEESFRTSLNIRPTYLDALMGLASLVAMDTGRGEEGWSLMQQALGVAPSNPDVHNNAGALLSKIGRPEDAVSAYKEALNLDPTHVAALTSLGKLYRSLGDNSKAESLLRRSLSLNPDPSTLLSLGGLLHSQGHLEEAEQALKQGVSLDPNRTDITCALAQVLLQSQHLTQASQLLHSALGAWPESGCVHLGLGVLRIQQGHFQDAVDHLTLGAELSVGMSERVDCLHLLGGAQKDLGRLDMAEQSYRQALSLIPERVSVRMNLGAVLHMKRDYTGARQEYERALSLDPSNTIVKDNLKKLGRAEAAAAAGKLK